MQSVHLMASAPQTFGMSIQKNRPRWGIPGLTTVRVRYVPRDAGRFATPLPVGWVDNAPSAGEPSPQLSWLRKHLGKPSYRPWGVVVSEYDAGRLENK